MKRILSRFTESTFDPIVNANSIHSQPPRSPSEAPNGTRRRSAFRRSALCIASLFITAAQLIGAGLAFAQPVEVPPTWGGDVMSRPRLTGSWGGVRDTLGERGVVLDVDLLLIPQGVFSGGVSTDGEFFGNAEYTLNVDTDKLGLWPGGFLKVVHAAWHSRYRTDK